MSHASIHLFLNFVVLGFRLNASYWGGSSVLLCVEGGLEGALSLVLFKFNFLGSTILSDLRLVKIFFYIILLIFVVLWARAQLLLNILSVLRVVSLVQWVHSFELLHLRVFVLTEPVVQYSHWHVLVVCPRLEGAILQFLFFVFLSYSFDFYSLVAWSLVQACAVLAVRQAISFLWSHKLTCLWSQLRFEGLLPPVFWSCLRVALFSPQLAFIHFLVI